MGENILLGKQKIKKSYEILLIWKEHRQQLKQFFILEIA